MALTTGEFDAIVPGLGAWAIMIAFRRVVDDLGEHTTITVGEIQDKVLAESEVVTEELYRVLGE